MGKRKRKKISSTLTWKATKGLFRLFFQGILKALPLALLTSVGFAIFWGIREDLYADPGFLVQKLEIVPLEALSPARHEELEKLYLNENLFKISLKKVQEKVKEGPLIREARVSRHFPKTLRIEVVERRPFLQIQLQSKGPYYWVSDDGVLVDEAPARDKNLLFVEAPEARWVQAEIGSELSLPGLKEGIHLVRAFWNHPLTRSERIERLRIDHLGNVALVLNQGPELRFGPQPMKKFYRLDSVMSLLKGPDRTRIIYMDLQYQDLIVKKK